MIAAGVGGLQGYLNVRAPGGGTFTQGAIIGGGGDTLTQGATLLMNHQSIVDNFNFGEVTGAAIGSGAITKFTGPSVLNVGSTLGEQLGVTTVTWPVSTGFTAIGTNLGKPDQPLNQPTQSR
ncbi:MAG TPA: hypothetical protein VF811_14405 [Parasulfuritortus sp.]